MTEKKPKLKITPAKGRPMLSWVGKKPLSYVTPFPAQHVETFDPSGEFRKSLLSRISGRIGRALIPKAACFFTVIIKRCSLIFSLMDFAARST